MKSIALWLPFYLRSRNFRDKASESILERVFEMQCKIEELQVRLGEAERKHQQLKDSDFALKRSPSVKPGTQQQVDNGGDDDAAVLQEDPDDDAADQLMARAGSSILQFDPK